MEASEANVRASSEFFVIIGSGKESPVSAVTPESLLAEPKLFFSLSFVFDAVSQK